jgi:serine phosphatase RsbU (regulator of sigma subunit)
MDIALCIIDKETLTLQFSGAFMPLYIVRDKELTELKADKMPIGLYHNSGHSFTEKSYKLQKDDMLYIATDGYADQFGGLEQKKFKVLNFRSLLTQISHQPVIDQKNILKETLEVWQNGYEQTDDITVLGIRIDNFIHSSDFSI